MLVVMLVLTGQEKSSEMETRYGVLPTLPFALVFGSVGLRPLLERARPTQYELSRQLLEQMDACIHELCKVQATD